VNDASPDNTWDTIVKLSNKYDNIIGIDIAKNSGQQSAIMAGLRQSKGDYVSVCDDDGQTPINTVFEFYDKMIEGGHDIVCANYIDRGKRSLFRRVGSWINTQMLITFLEKPRSVTTSVYFLAKRFVIDEMIKYDNAYPYLNGLILRTTHNIGNVPVQQLDRIEGKSGYNLRKLLSTWINGLTSFSIKPLRIATFLGMFFAIAGFISTLVIIVIKLTHDNIALGWTSTMAVILLIGGIIMMILGIIGEYVGRIYLCLNHNPQYVIRETVKSRDDGRDGKE
jgi:undecaprenyl-phosphate 4-deoxy-4-formamido-L-arabinose transferase